MKKQPTKKKHHYVPEAYLRSFCGIDGKLAVYRKDAPKRPFRSHPGEVAFHKYYYAQPLPDGGRDTNSLEDLFSQLESKWPPIVDAFAANKTVNDALEDVFAFVALQRARVPAAREAAERMLAAAVDATAKQLDVAGRLPPLPEGYDGLLDNVLVSIDPHQSIHAMVRIVKAMGRILHRLGLVVVHNQTDRHFITSDNPVIYFDPTASDDELLPYALKPNGPIELMMPIAPKLMLLGTTDDKQRFAKEGIEYREISCAEAISRINEKIARFAYEVIFAGEKPDENMICKHADQSPVLRVSHLPLANGLGIHFQSVFGQRTKLPKWRG